MAKTPTHPGHTDPNLQLGIRCRQHVDELKADQESAVDDVGTKITLNDSNIHMHHSAEGLAS
jgi:hypothetical protein